MEQGLQKYYDQWDTPWLKLYYRMVWAQLGDLRGRKILDFGSGFGWNANHFAKYNDVFAIEPNTDMIKHRQVSNIYNQINGNLKSLKLFEDKSFDIILCHNVFEYCPEERLDILQEFDRLIKNEGLISIVKHNHAGAIMQKVVFENNLEQALDMLINNNKINEAFGKINYYNLPELIKDLSIEITKTLGLRTFWALQPNEYKVEKRWADKMFVLEWNVSDKEDFKSISFFNHILLEKL